MWILWEQRTPHHKKCPRRLSLQVKGKEYDVAKDIDAKSFISRVESCMPIMGTFDVTIPHITKLDNAQSSQHCLLHGVYCTHNITFGQKSNVNELHYRVNLIGSNGISDPKCTDQVFDGHLMNKWIARVGTGIKVKNKFIYDGTISTTP